MHPSKENINKSKFITHKYTKLKKNEKFLEGNIIS